MLIWLLLAASLAIALILMWLLRHFLIVVVVEGMSMAPTLQHGDRVLAICHWPAKWVHKEDIVLLRPWLIPSPEASSLEIKFYIKRIVGLGGETFTASCCKVPTIDHLDQTTTNGQQSRQRTWHIPPRSVFVCGDNGPESIDSRHWGSVPIESILGIVVMKLPRRTSFSPSSGKRHQVLSHPLGLSAGQDAPPFMAQTLDEDVVTFATFSGQAVVFVFFAPSHFWHDELSFCLTLAPKAKEAGIVMVFVSCTGVQPTRPFIDDLQISVPILVAPRASNPFLKDYHISATPAYCFVNQLGKVQSAGPLSRKWGAWKTLVESWVSLEDDKSFERADSVTDGMTRGQSL
jgi:signal peptidase I